MCSLFDVVSAKCSKKIELDRKYLVTFLNHHSYQVARKNVSEFKRFDYIYCDGIFLTLMLRMLGIECRRRSFDMTSLAPVVFKNAIQKDLSIALIGGENGVAKSAAEILSSRFLGLKVVLTNPGFFVDESDRKSTLDKVTSLAPDIVVCGMGTPNQEKFLLDLVDNGWKGKGYTCGGFFHQTARKGICYYPRWIDKCNLRWLFRLYDEPALFKRYSFGLVGFFWCLLCDLYRKR